MSGPRHSLNLRQEIALVASPALYRVPEVPARGSGVRTLSPLRVLGPASSTPTPSVSSSAASGESFTARITSMYYGDEGGGEERPRPATAPSPVQLSTDVRLAVCTRC